MLALGRPLYPKGGGFVAGWTQPWRALPRLQELRRERRLLDDPELTRARLDALVKERLEGLLLRSHASVPYYAERLGELARRYPRFAGCPLSELPVLRKADVRREGRRLYSSRPAVGTRQSSSGSTGEPVTIRRDLFVDHYDGMLLHKRLAVTLRPPWPPLVTQWVYLDLVPPELEPAHRRYWCLLPEAGWTGYLSLPVEPAAPQAAAAADFLAAARPAVLMGNPRKLLLFAALADEGRPRCASLGVRCVISSGETLAPRARAALESAFQAPVIDHYITSEIGSIGIEQPGRAGLLCDQGRVIVEALDENDRPVAAGALGALCVTSLKSECQPFIRYRTGDLGTVTADGPFTRIDTLVGREDDLFVRADGSLLHPECFSEPFAELGLGRFELIQDAPGRVRLLTEQPPTDAVRESVTGLVREALKENGLRLSFEALGTKPLRKARPFRSLLRQA